MGQIFISHVEENADVALGIADGLEEAGYGTWCYERDALPGPSYLLQTARQIESSAAVVLLISADSLGSHQVTAEVVRAHESARPFVPVLIGISHVEFAARQPEWREALGSSTSIALPPGGVALLLPRVVDGLRGLGIAPSDGDGDDGTAPAAVPHVYRVPAATTAPAPPVAPPASMARRPLLVGAGVAVAALLLLAVGVVAIGGGGGDDTQPAQDASARTSASTVAEPSGASGGERASGSEEQPQQFASATNTPLATSAGSLRVASSVLTTKACPPTGIPGDCLSAGGSDRYLVLRLAPAGGGRAALSQVFLNEAHQSSLSFGGGLQAGNFRVSLDERANEIEIVYGVLSAGAVDDAVLLHWQANQPLLLAVTT